MAVVPITLRSHTQLHRGKHRRRDDELHTTRLVGGGWWYDCSCGYVGPWEETRDEAQRARRAHEREAHGQR